MGIERVITSVVAFFVAYRGMGLNFKHEAAETPRHRTLRQC